MKKSTPVLLIFIILSCSGPASVYNFQFPLSDKQAELENSDMKVNIPPEWYTADNDEFNLWLVKNDLSQTIIFQELHLDSNPTGKKRGNLLSELVSISKTFRKAKFGSKFVDLKKDERFSYNGNDFAGYEYVDDSGNHKRIVLFENNDRYFEVITSVTPPVEKTVLNELFSIQNSILRSIK